MKPATIVTLLVAILGCPLAFAGTAERVINLDVVELLAGREVAGQAELSLNHDGFAYRFATPENRRAFAQDPARYAVQMDGACSRVGALGTFGKPELYTVHDGRLYIFRTPECRRTFLNAPERFLPPAAPTTPVDPDVAAAGRQLIEQAIAAIGGRERLSQVKAWRYTTVRAPTTAQRESREQRWLRTADGRFRYDAFNGDEHAVIWLLNGDDSYIKARYQRRLYAAGRGALRRRMLSDVPALLRASSKPGFAVVSVADGTVGDTPVKRVGTVVDGILRTLSIDPESGRVLALEYPVRGPWRGFHDAVERYSDFQAVDGLVLPHTRTFSYDGEERRTERLSKIDINPPIDAALFTLSAELRDSADGAVAGRSDSAASADDRASTGARSDGDAGATCDGTERPQDGPATDGAEGHSGSDCNAPARPESSEADHPAGSHDHGCCGGLE
jgi:YHS domain-containing protein